MNKEEQKELLNHAHKLGQKVNEALELADNCVLLNMGNYNEDQVEELNNTMIELCQILSKN